MKATFYGGFFLSGCNPFSIFICLLFLFCQNGAKAQLSKPHSLEISEGNIPEVGDKLWYFQEAEEKMSPNEVAAKFSQNLFKPLHGTIFNLPYTMNNHWLGVRIKNSTAQTAMFYYEVANPHLHELELFKADSGKLISLGVCGDAFPFFQRTIRNRNFVYHISMSAKEETSLLLRINTGGRPVTVPINLLSQQEYDEEKMDSYLFWGIISGFILLVTTLSLLLFFLLKERLYLIYCINNILLLIWIIGRNGLGYQYIWPGYPEVMARIIYFSAELNVVIYLLFMQLFVGQSKSNSRFYTATRWVMGILLLLVSLIFLPYPTGQLEILLVYQAITDLMNFIAIFLLFAGLIEKIRQNNSLAKLLFISTLFSFIGVILLLLVRIDVLEANAFTLNAVYGGFIIELILLAIGLALRYRKQLEEKEDLKNELLISEIDKAAKIAMATENERLRIAADMHDDLGASLSGLQLMSELSGRKENMAEVKSDIYKIHLSAKELSLKMRDIVWTLDPNNDTLENLVLYIHTYGQQLFEDSGTLYKGLLPNFIPAIIVEGNARRQLLLLVKEAFTNITKHAKASEVYCTFQFSENFNIHIQDNGGGIPLQNGKGNGLKNMQNRINQFEGELIISSEKGTSITFVLPFSKLATEKGLLKDTPL